MIGLHEPIEAIQFRLEEQGLKPADLAQYLGSKSMVSEVLNRKHPLEPEHDTTLHSGLGIPAEVLLREPGGQLSGKYSDIN